MYYLMFRSTPDSNVGGSKSETDETSRYGY